MQKICQRITLYNPVLTGFVLLKEDEAKTKCSGIINFLFVVLVDIKHMQVDILHIAMQLVKYPYICSSRLLKNLLLTLVNVMGDSSVLFYVSLKNCHGIFSLGKGIHIGFISLT